jgi:hypothetical protein
MELGVWDAAELLNEVVDDSDPDIGLPQLEHLLQTAEAIRAAYPQARPAACSVLVRLDMMTCDIIGSDCIQCTCEPCKQMR